MNSIQLGRNASNIIELVVQKRELWTFISHSVFAGVSVGILLLKVDSYYYCRPVLAPLNLVLYNVLSGRGPALYGTEPGSFYVINCLLNLNLIFPLALLGLPVTMLTYSLLYKPRSGGAPNRWAGYFSVAYIEASLWAWLTIFFRQPHKEERFLFPAYPLMCLSAAFTLDGFERLWNRAWTYGAAPPISTRVPSTQTRSPPPPRSSSDDPPQTPTPPPSPSFGPSLSSNFRPGRAVPDRRWAWPKWLATSPSSFLSVVYALMLTGFVMLSVSRSVAMYRNYHAPFDIYVELGEILSARYANLTSNEATKPRYFGQRLGKPEPERERRVCVGKEWYRFPNSFFLPKPERLRTAARAAVASSSDGGKVASTAIQDRIPKETYQLAFLESEFRGLLPAQFPPVGTGSGTGSLPNVTCRVPPAMNDENREERSRYVALDDCDWLIDLSLRGLRGVASPPLEPDYASDGSRWRVAARRPFLYAPLSHQLLRAFYIPSLSELFSVYGEYVLLEAVAREKDGV